MSIKCLRLPFIALLDASVGSPWGYVYPNPTSILRVNYNYKLSTHGYTENPINILSWLKICSFSVMILDITIQNVPAGLIPQVGVCNVDILIMC